MTNDKDAPVKQAAEGAAIVTHEDMRIKLHKLFGEISLIAATSRVDPPMTDEDWENKLDTITERSDEGYDLTDGQAPPSSSAAGTPLNSTSIESLGMTPIANRLFEKYRKQKPSNVEINELYATIRTLERELAEAKKELAEMQSRIGDPWKQVEIVRAERDRFRDETHNAIQEKLTEQRRAESAEQLAEERLEHIVQAERRLSAYEAEKTSDAKKIAEWVHGHVIEMQELKAALTKALADKGRMVEALEAAAEALYNPFEPDNQSKAYQAAKSVIAGERN